MNYDPETFYSGTSSQNFKTVTYLLLRLILNNICEYKTGLILNFANYKAENKEKKIFFF